MIPIFKCTLNIAFLPPIHDKVISHLTKSKVESFSAYYLRSGDDSTGGVEKTKNEYNVIVSLTDRN